MRNSPSGRAQVLSLSQEEAQRFNHNYIGTEHLLLGLIREEEGIGAKALVNLGVELEKARNAVEFIIGRGDRIVLGEIGLTPRAKKVIELSVDEARRLGHHYIGTEHLLLGIIREGEGIAAGVLESLGVNLERARSSVLRDARRSRRRAIHRAARHRGGYRAPVSSVSPWSAAMWRRHRRSMWTTWAPVPLSAGPEPAHAPGRAGSCCCASPDAAR